MYADLDYCFEEMAKRARRRSIIGVGEEEELDPDPDSTMVDELWSEWQMKNGGRGEDMSSSSDVDAVVGVNVEVSDPSLRLQRSRMPVLQQSFS